MTTPVSTSSNPAEPVDAHRAHRDIAVTGRSSSRRGERRWHAGVPNDMLHAILLAFRADFSGRNGEVFSAFLGP